MLINLQVRYRYTFNCDILELIGKLIIECMVLFLYVSDTHLSFLNVNLVYLALNEVG